MYALVDLLYFFSFALAQTVIPFAVDGRLDVVTITDSSYNSGGTASVNGFTVTIPQNLLVRFPAAFKPWRELSGFIGSEVSITGNVVNGIPTAGLIDVSEYLLEASSGIIESIDNTAGTMKILNGPTIRINDPNGVYGAPYTTTPAFTADDQNPSITAFSGFPMCIPRSATSVDPLCPSTNRLAGQRSFNAPDPLVMAPFVVGDFLEFSGINVNGMIVCYAINAPNVQILTPDGPTYIRVEDAIIGVFDGGANVENADSRFIGYTSNPQAITLWALDLDPCTGEESERAIGSAPYKVGDNRNKWIWRADTRVDGRYTREYAVKANDGMVTTKNNITAGRYVQPVTEWIFPESNLPGNIPPVNDFSALEHLAKGIGYTPGGVLIGQLKPWPGANIPQAPVCSPFTPGSAPPPSSGSGTGSTPPAPESVTPPSGPVTPLLASAATISTRPGVAVPLKVDVTNSASFAASDLTFFWSQISGPAVNLASALGQSTSFTASASTTFATYIFTVTVKSTSSGTTATSTFTVTSDPSTKDTVVIDAYTATNSNGGHLSVSAHTNIVGFDAKLRVYLAATATGTSFPMTPVSGKPGYYFYDAPKGTKKTAGVTVISDGGGSTSRTTTTA